MLCISAICCQFMKYCGSFIHACVTKNVARNPASLSSGATAVRCERTASSKVSTTVLGGIRDLPGAGAAASTALPAQHLPAIHQDRHVSLHHTERTHAGLRIHAAFSHGVFDSVCY